MLRCDLDLRISVFEASAPRISEPVLHARLRATSMGPPAGPPEYLILCRDASGSPPSWISKSEVTDQDVVRVVALLDAAGLSKRAPRVVANDSLLGAGPYLALEARIRGRAASLTLPLQDAGFSGEDAQPIRAVFLLLAELAPAGRRPAVRDVIDRLVIERAPAFDPRHPRDGGTSRGLLGRGRPAEEALAGRALGAAGRDGRRGPMPSSPRGTLADP